MCDNWKTTADMFSSLFDKPKMTEKLLSKPPFKYIFDIIMETQKATGFAKGLFSDDESKSAFYDNRDKKIEFLKKIVDLTSLVLKEEFQAKPTKIVAGQEPEHTNTLLQGVYRSALSLQDFGPYVKKVLKMHGQDVGGDDEPEQQQAKPPTKKPREEERKPKKPQVVNEQEERRKKPPQQQPQNEEEEEQTEQTEVKIQKKFKSKEGHGKFIQDALKDNDDDLVEKQQESKPQQEEGGTKIKMKKRLGGGAKKKTSTTGISSNIGGGSSSNQAGSIEDTEQLCKLVQQICQNANPLGKSLEFINDDIESMNNELKYWNQQYSMYKDKMSRELRVTEETLSPLQDKLTEIELSISDEKAKIQNMKSQIIKNQFTIQTLLHSVVANK